MSKKWICNTRVLIGLVLVAVAMVSAMPAFAQEPTPPLEVMAASPASGDVVYAASGPQLLRSEDGGQTWMVVATLPGTITALVPGNHSPALIYAGTEANGVLRSMDGGKSWQPLAQGLDQFPGAVLSISALALDPEDDGLVYAATGYWLGTTELHFSPAAVVFSTDNGSTWLTLAQPPLNSGRIVALTPEADRPLAVVGEVESGASAEYAAAASDLIAVLTAENSTPAQQAAVARALAILHDPAAVKALVAALQSADLNVVVSAAHALGAIRAAEAVPVLREMLFAESPVAPRAIAEALAAIGTPAAIGALTDALAGDSTMPSHHAAMAALEQLGSAAVPALLEMLDSEAPLVRRDAAELLGWIGDPTAVNALVAALQSDDVQTRGQAAWALGEIGSPAGYEALAAVVSGDPSAEVRMHATQALARLPQFPAFADRAAAAQEPATDPMATTSTGQTSGLRLPDWLTAALPAVRWVVLAIALITVALLPWYQGYREERRRRRN